MTGYIFTTENNWEPPLILLPTLRRALMGRPRGPWVRWVEDNRPESFLWKTADVSHELLLFAIECAEHVLPFSEKYYPMNHGPHLAVFAARRVLENPSADNIVSAENFGRVGEFAPLGSTNRVYSAAAASAAFCRKPELAAHYSALYSAIGAWPPMDDKGKEFHLCFPNDEEIQWQTQRLDELILPKLEIKP